MGVLPAFGIVHLYQEISWNSSGAFDENETRNRFFANHYFNSVRCPYEIVIGLEIQNLQQNKISIRVNDFKRRSFYVLGYVPKKLLQIK